MRGIKYDLGELIFSIIVVLVSGVVGLDVKVVIRDIFCICVCVVLVLEFHFLEIPSELGVVAVFSIYDWESRHDEIFLLFIFILDHI